MRELLKDEKEFMVCGGVPQDWRLQRTVAKSWRALRLPLVDVEAAETQALMSEQLASELVALGYSEDLDTSDLTNRERRLSRLIAEWAYTQIDEDGPFRCKS